MLTELAIDLASGQIPEGPRHNCALEAFTVHARLLLDVLYMKPNFPDDVVVGDFLEEPEVWKRQRPTLTPVLKQIRGRVGTEIAHLSYRRQEVTADMKKWPFVQIALDLCAIIKKFLALVPSQFLGDRWQRGNPCDRLTA